jgi:hypothetical protein
VRVYLFLSFRSLNSGGTDQMVSFCGSFDIHCHSVSFLKGVFCNKISLLTSYALFEIYQCRRV